MSSAGESTVEDIRVPLLLLALQRLAQVSRQLWSKRPSETLRVRVACNACLTVRLELVIAYFCLRQNLQCIVWRE
jgi:hypothetical protein